MRDFSREKKIRIYNKIAAGNYRGLNPKYKDIYDVIGQIESRNCYGNIYKSDDEKIAFLDQILNTSKRILNKWDKSSLKYISFLIMSERFSNESINELLSLTFFPEECFIDNDLELYNKYLYIIETLLIYEDLYSASMLKDTNLFNYINAYLEYKIKNNSNLSNNIFIPGITLYCLKNNISLEVYFNMINISNDNYDELLSYLELNDDGKHYYELNTVILNKLIDKENIKVLK